MQRRERRLRETVAAASGCLGQLGREQRRVLALRAGLGAGPPRSRGSVARRLDISVKRVARLERSGLKRLRSLAKGGGCSPPTTVQERATAPTAAAAAFATPVASSQARESRTGERKTRGGNDGAGKSRGGDGGAGTPGDHGGVAGVSSTNLPSSTSGGLNLTIPLIVLLLAALTVLLARLLGRRTPATAGAAAEDEQREPPVRAPWIPWRRSTMTGPGWTAAPPPPSSGERSWATSPAEDAEEAPREPDAELDLRHWSAPRQRR